MNYREKMKEYLKEPDEYSSQWGKWGILNKEQRTLIKRLLKEMDSADIVIKNQFEEIERLNNIINELEKWLEEEQDRLARETSNIYEDSLGKTRLVNENIYEEVQKIKDKLQELKGDDKE